MGQLVELVEYLVKNIAPNSDKVEVSLTEFDGVNVIKVLVLEEDMSVVIGKNGVIANSIRTVVQAAAYSSKLGKVRINIDSL